MRAWRPLRAGCLAAGLALVSPGAFAQFGLPKLPGMKHKDPAREKDKKPQNGDEGAKAAGIPVPLDSPVFQAFQRMAEAKSYQQRMTMQVNDPQAQQMLAQMGFAPTEMLVTGDTRQVTMHFKMPVPGQVEDFQLRTVVRNGVYAKKWSSPAQARILREQDASIAKQLAEAEQQSAKSIARSLATNGPTGLASAGVTAGAAAANVAIAGKIRKQAHDYWEWSCSEGGGGGTTAQQHSEPPPLTDLRVIGDQTVDGAAVATYEFFVRDNGKFQGPMQLHVSKDTGLPMRIGMLDPSGRGSMRIDYYGFNEGEIELPPCMADK
jgi:hypothetical protein